MTAFSEGAIGNVIEDHVVMLIASGKILFCVIDDVVGSN